MKLKILTPYREVLDATVEAVNAEASDGRIGIRPQHEPLVTPLAMGLLTFVSQGREHTAAVMGGMLYTDGVTATVLSDAAELGEEIDTVRAQQAKERAEARLRDRMEGTDTQRAELALARSLLRLRATSAR